jgi:hypothetical protein
MRSRGTPLAGARVMTRAHLSLLVALAACSSDKPGDATAVVAQAETCTAGDLYSATKCTKTAPHELFCGNVAKASQGDSPGGQCSGGSCCLSQETVKTPDGNAVEALERVEVRGWIHQIEVFDDGAKGFHDHEDNDDKLYEEYVFYLQLDLDWDASPCLPANVKPINSLQKFATAFTPYNGFPGEDLATPSGWAKGGAAPRINPYIKVEVDGWYEHGRLAPRSPDNDWVPATGANAPARVRWPFDPNQPPSDIPRGALAEGQYVRIVGTQWEDGHHETSGWAGCWDTGATSERGWKEIHPVDFMARVTPRPSTANGIFSASTYAYLALCDTASVQNWEIVAPPRPTASAALRYDRIEPDGFTLGNVSPPLTVTTMTDRIRVSVGIQNWGTWPVIHTGRWFSVFRVFWEPCTPLTRNQACGAAVCGNVSDGCSSTISCGTCAAGSSCRAGQCCPTCPVLEVGDACGTAFSSCGNCTACPSGSACSGGHCACKVGTKPCDGRCIPNANLCQ